MYDFFVGLTFVAMVLAPCVVAMVTANGDEKSM